MVEIRALESTLKSGRNFSNIWLISNVFPLFFEKSKKGVYFLKIGKMKKTTLGIHAKKGYTKFGSNPSTLKYFKIGEKSVRTIIIIRRRPPGSILGHFLSLIKTELIGILTSGFFLRGLFNGFDKYTELQLAEWTRNIFKKFAKIGYSVVGYIALQRQSRHPSGGWGGDRSINAFPPLRFKSR